MKMTTPTLKTTLLLAVVAAQARCSWARCDAARRERTRHWHRLRLLLRLRRGVRAAACDGEEEATANLMH